MSNTIRALVINVASASSRRRFQSEQLALLGLTGEILTATTPQDIAPQELERRAHAWARPLRPTEVACLLSHRAAWERTITNGVPTLILEDDAVLSDDLPQVLDWLSGMKGIHYVNLEALKQKKFLSVRRQPIPNTRFSLSLLLRDRGGAGAYVLWPDGAKLLLKYTERLSPLADSALLLAPGITRLQLEPAASTQAFLVERRRKVASHLKSSTFVGMRPPYLNVLTMLSGKLLRLRISFVLAWRRLKHLGRVEERMIGFDTARIAMNSNTVSRL